MDELNGKYVTENYCDICGCNIKNKNKHINTKKHLKEMKNTETALKDGLCLINVMNNCDVNDNESVHNTINILKSMMNRK